MCAVLAGGASTPRGRPASRPPRSPDVRPTTPGSSSPPGSTGKPKGVPSRTARAAAFVDAEADLFLPRSAARPRRPGAGRPVRRLRRLLRGDVAGLAPRRLPGARAAVAGASGADSGRWLVERGITVVSTVPTLAALWPAEALRRVRLLIFGGEACPPELVERLAAPGREVWNTYGPTEATVVACAAPLVPGSPVRIGLPLDGWELAVVDAAGEPVRRGETGELVIGGVGPRPVSGPGEGRREVPRRCRRWAGRAPTAAATWCAPTAEGLIFVGRADDQVKLGGRRIELGEVDAALRALPGVTAAAAAVQDRRPAARCWSATSTAKGRAPDLADARAAARRAAAGSAGAGAGVVDGMPTRTSGKVDRRRCPGRCPARRTRGRRRGRGPGGHRGWLAGTLARTARRADRARQRLLRARRHAA